MNAYRPLSLVLGLLALIGCEELYPPTMRPDYTIRVTPTAQGSVAAAPECPSWNDALANPLDNQPLPQYGCASARNLADMVENPNDLVEGRDLGKSRGVTAVGSIRRYDNNQPRGLIMPVSETSQSATTTAPTGASSMSGDVTAATATSAIKAFPTSP